MTSNNLPPLMIGLFALMFFGLALFYPWLSRALGVEKSRPEHRALAFILGLVMLTLWSIWYSNRQI
ncbi:MAG: hypothetical protein ACR2QG_01605 [Gammaproteobacteria bacterium]